MSGVEVKILQYRKISDIEVCGNQIDLKNLIESYLTKKQSTTIPIVINLEKDSFRYHSAVNELKRISYDKFVHLKGTYWKKKEDLEKDLSYILNFLKQFNPGIKTETIKINEFSETNDENIFIQDGPLACYCSHLRAMIYGYLNFKDYTIIVEDDIFIADTEKIEKYIKCIPDDWDILFLNSIAKSKKYDEPYYKFVTGFHSSHFYIINNKCFPTIFKHMYPIVDQVDVLTSNMIDKLNIYNIEDTVYQKDIETNTQNNLQSIFNSPNYVMLRQAIDKIEKLCKWFTNKILPYNKKRNEFIVSQLMYCVLYDFILNKPAKSNEDYVFDNKYKNKKKYKELVSEIEFFIQCSRKGIDTQNDANNLANNILYTIQKFSLHDKKVKAYDFGSTSHTYLVDDIVIKKYNDKLRWVSEGHDNSKEIFAKELKILESLQSLDCVPKLIDYNEEEMIIKLSYAGKSLYDDFKLPKNWKEQIRNIFSLLTDNKIYYPEFTLRNILVLKKKIKFIDFGLAEFNKDNEQNCERFINLLDILDKRFSQKTDQNKRRHLCSTFLNNLK